MTMNGSSIILTFTSYIEIGSAKDVLFVIIFLIYLASVFANAALMVLIYLDRALHKPMYIFLFNFIFHGLIGSTAVWPKVMDHLVTDIHSISYEACLVQTFFSSTYGACTYTMLTVMAYDRYVCIFQPLQYHTIMTPHKVRVLLVVANLPAGLVMGQICLTSGIPLCRYNIHKIFCDNLAVSHLGCRKTIHTPLANIYGICLMVLLVVLPILLVLLSYLKIIALTLKLSADARKKAFVTCTPHLIVFLNFSLVLLFSLIYNRIRHSNITLRLNIFSTIVYILLPPLLHPIIYGLKNQEIKSTLSKFITAIFTFTRFQLQPKR